MLDLQAGPSEGDGEVEAGHKPGVHLRHVGLPVHLAHPVTGQPTVEPQQVGLPAGGVSPGLPELLEHPQPQLPALLGRDVLRGRQEEGEVPGGRGHRPVRRAEHGRPPRQHLTGRLVGEISSADFHDGFYLILEPGLALDKSSHGQTGVLPELVKLKQGFPVYYELRPWDEIFLLYQGVQHFGVFIQGDWVNILRSQQAVQEFYVKYVLFPENISVREIQLLMGVWPTW